MNEREFEQGTEWDFDRRSQDAEGDNTEDSSDFGIPVKLSAVFAFVRKTLAPAINKSLFAVKDPKDMTEKERRELSLSQLAKVDLSRQSGEISQRFWAEAMRRLHEAAETNRQLEEINNRLRANGTDR